ncbi:MAG: hypothetical protein H6650_02260 [Ardenticatenales bacterium]|nr:hypothetical protein [Ardenticatenales bacterium]
MFYRHIRKSWTLALLLLIMMIMTGTTRAANPDIQQVQIVVTDGAYDWEAFTIGGDTYLAVANNSQWFDSQP